MSNLSREGLHPCHHPSHPLQGWLQSPWKKSWKPELLFTDVFSSSLPPLTPTPSQEPQGPDATFTPSACTVSLDLRVLLTPLGQGLTQSCPQQAP